MLFTTGIRLPLQLQWLFVNQKIKLIHMKIIRYFIIGVLTTCMITAFFYVQEWERKPLKYEDIVSIQNHQINYNDNVTIYLSGILKTLQDANNNNLSSTILDADYYMSRDLNLNNSKSVVSGVGENISVIDKIYSKDKEEYQRLISNYSHAEGDEQIMILQKLWQLSPEIGFDDDLLTLLSLATRDPNAQIESLANIILNDLMRFRDSVVKPEEQLISQIIEINNTQQRNSDLSVVGDETHTFESLDLNRKNVSSVEMNQRRNDIISQLTQLALNSEDANQKDYAMMNLMQLDHDSALHVIQYQLLNSENIDERYRAIEKLRAASGDISTLKLRSLLEIATNDHQTSIAEYAQASITMLDQYEKDLSEENTTIDDDFIDTQEFTYDDSAGYGGPR